MENNEQSNPTQNRESTVGKEEAKDDQKLNINIIAQNQKEKSQNKEGEMTYEEYINSLEDDEKNKVKEI